MTVNLCPLTSDTTYPGHGWFISLLTFTVAWAQQSSLTFQSGDSVITLGKNWGWVEGLCRPCLIKITNWTFPFFSPLAIFDGVLVHGLDMVTDQVEQQLTQSALPLLTVTHHVLLQKLWVDHKEASMRLTLHLADLETKLFVPVHSH